MIENPLFIVGTERSGSNLLRLLLNELPDVCVPHPPHLLRDLSPLLGRYGDLKAEANFKKLIADAVRLVDLHFAPWPLRVDADAVLREARQRDLYAVYAAIYEQFRRHCGNARWACKSTFMIHHLDEIMAHHAQPQFIHLVRDPRDVAVSARRSVFSFYHPYHVAELWRQEQALGLAASRRHPPASWLTVRYEDLTADPAQEMKRICEFLHQPYSPTLLRFFEKAPAQEISELSRSWKNLRSAVMKGNTGKFQTALSAREIGWIEAVACEEMQAFDYKLESVGQKHPGRIRRLGFQIEESIYKIREESAALILDRNARRRWRKDAFLLRLKYY